MLPDALIHPLSLVHPSSLFLAFFAKDRVSHRVAQVKQRIGRVPLDRWHKREYALIVAIERHGKGGTMDRQGWEEERAYCSALVRSGGNHNVPRDAVGSYLELQRTSAERERQEDIVTALRLMETLWRGKQRRPAVRVRRAGNE